MKKKVRLVVILMAIISVSCFPEKARGIKDQSIMEREFFGFSLVFNQKEIEEVINDLGIELFINNDPKLQLVDIHPKDKIIGQPKNTDFSFGLYKDQILSMTFFNRSDDLLVSFIHDLEIAPEITTNDDDIVYIWNINDILIKCRKYKSSGLVNYIFFNNKVSESYQSMLDEIMKDDPFF